MALGKNPLIVSCGIVLAALLARAGAVYAVDCNFGCILNYDFESTESDATIKYFYYSKAAVAKVINQEGTQNNKIEGSETVENRVWNDASCTRNCTSSLSIKAQAKQGSCTGGESADGSTRKYCVNQSTK